MTTTRRTFLAGCAALSAGLAALDLVAGCSSSTGGATVGHEAPDDPAAIALEAFYAGFPLVTTMRTMQTFGSLGGVNALITTPGLGNPSSRLVVAPNHDTVYVLAVLDLRSGPLVIDLPEIPDRYHVMQFIDAWMGGFGLLGTRTTAGRSGSWVIAPAGWNGAVPDGSERLDCPTAHAMMLGRIRAVDDEDAKAAVAIARQIRLRPLDDGGPKPLLAEPLGPPQAVGENGLGYFDELSAALVDNPPVTAEQRRAIEAVAGVRGSPSVLTAAVTAGLAALAAGRGLGSERHNGWDVNLSLGTGDTDRGLEERAVIARYFWGPVPAAEAVYPRLAVASDDQPLDGSKRYTITFGPGEQPPVDAFWSITAYGPDLFLVPNPQNRYSISGQTPGLELDEHGALTLRLQRDAPVGAEANWLPVPPGPYHLILRLYLPGPAILDGTYDYPTVTVVP